MGFWRAKNEKFPALWRPKFSRPAGWMFCRVVWPSKIIGRKLVPSSGPVLIVANHTGLIDGPVLHGAIPRPNHILIKQEMFKRFLGWYLPFVGQIPVDRTTPRAALGAGLGVLKAGGTVAIFPEGARGRGDGTDAKAGAAWLAVNGAAQIVPVAILGTRRSGESIGIIPRPGRRLTIEFGQPFTVVPQEGESRSKAVARAATEIQEGLVSHVDQAVAKHRIELPTD